MKFSKTKYLRKAGVIHILYYLTYISFIYFLKVLLFPIFFLYKVRLIRPACVKRYSEMLNRLVLMVNDFF